MDYVDNEDYDKGYNEGHEEGYDLALIEMTRDDLSDCPYYTGTGTCSYGCSDEPQCQTCCPRDGWPTERHPIVVALRTEHDALAEQLAVANNELAILSDASALAEALCFYANPETYFACAFWFDPPTGGFDDDFDEDYAEWTDHDFKRAMPGKTARAAIRARLNGGAEPRPEP